jgi:hypothetical protein
MNAKRAGILELSDSAGAQGVEVTLDRTGHDTSSTVVASNA